MASIGLSWQMIADKIKAEQISAEIGHIYDGGLPGADLRSSWERSGNLHPVVRMFKSTGLYCSKGFDPYSSGQPLAISGELETLINLCRENVPLSENGPFPADIFSTVC